MNEPIDTNTPPTGLSETESLGATDQVDDVQAATDAFRAAISDTSSAPGGIEQVVMDTARRLQEGTITYEDAPGAVIDGVIAERFGYLDSPTQDAMKTALREALTQDTYFMVELENVLGQALMRVD
jgi:hypothetical protein